jgi:hypothetical protein
VNSDRRVFDRGDGLLNVLQLPGQTKLCAQSVAEHEIRDRTTGVLPLKSMRDRRSRCDPPSLTLVAGSSA